MGASVLQWSMHHIDSLLLGAAAAGSKLHQPEAELASSTATASFMLACVLLCAVIAKASLISTHVCEVGISWLRQAWPIVRPTKPAQASMARTSLALELLCVLGLARWIDPQICVAHPGLIALATASLVRQSTPAALRALCRSWEPRRTWLQADRALYVMMCGVAYSLCYAWALWAHLVLLAVHFTWLLAISVQLSIAAVRVAQEQRQLPRTSGAATWTPSVQVPGLPTLVLAWLVIRQQAAAWALAALQINGLELLPGQPLQLFNPSGHAMGSPGFALLGAAVVFLAVINEGRALRQAAGLTREHSTAAGQPAQALQGAALRWLNAKFRPELQVMQLALDELEAELRQAAHRQRSTSQQAQQPHTSEACAAFQTGRQALRGIKQVLDGCAAWVEASQLSQFPPTALDWVSPRDEVKAGIASHIPALVKQGVQCRVQLQIGPWQFEGDLHHAVTLDWPDMHLRLAPGLIQSAVYTLLQNVLDHGLLGGLSSRVRLAVCLQPEAASAAASEAVSAGTSKQQAARSSDQACSPSSCWVRAKVRPVLASRASTPGAALDASGEVAPRSAERAFTISLPRHLDASATLQSVCSADATPSAQQCVAKFPTSCPRPKLAIDFIDDSRSPSACYDAHTLEARTWELSIAVQDNGPGIPAAQAGQIFTPFTTLRPAQKQHGGGLSLCTLSQVLQATGGELKISTSPSGQPGTRAALRLSAPALRSAELLRARHKRQPRRSSSGGTLRLHSSARGASVPSASPTLVCTWFHPTAPRQQTPWVCQTSEPPMPSVPRRTASFKINSSRCEYFCSQASPGFTASSDSAIGLRQQNADASCWIRCLQEPSSSRSHHLESAAPRVLAVDDMQSTLRHVVRCIERAGVCASHIDQASDGDEAVRLVQAAFTADKPYSLILCDNTMPVMTGDQAVREMRALGVAVPIIGITGNSEPQDVRAFLDAGATQVLIKPVAVSQLLRIIQQALQLPSSRGSVANEVAPTPASLDGNLALPESGRLAEFRPG